MPGEAHFGVGRAIKLLLSEIQGESGKTLLDKDYIKIQSVPSSPRIGPIISKYPYHHCHFCH